MGITALALQRMNLSTITIHQLSSACIPGCSDQKFPPFPIRLHKHYSVAESAFWLISSIVHFEVGDSETSERAITESLDQIVQLKFKFHFLKKHILIYNSQFMIQLQQENRRFSVYSNITQNLQIWTNNLHRIRHTVCCKNFVGTKKNERNPVWQTFEAQKEVKQSIASSFCNSGKTGSPR